MNSLKVVFAVLLATLLALPAWCFAQAGKGQGGQGIGCSERFKELDANRDGKVTKEEFLAVPHAQGNAEQRFGSMDAGSKGYVTVDEFCAGKGRGARKGMGQGGGTAQ